MPLYVHMPWPTALDVPRPWAEQPIAVGLCTTLEATRRKSVRYSSACTKDRCSQWYALNSDRSSIEYLDQAHTLVDELLGTGVVVVVPALPKSIKEVSLFEIAG